jgi:hypothetical protein
MSIWISNRAQSDKIMRKGYRKSKENKKTGESKIFSKET